MTEKLLIFLINSGGIIKHGENGIYYEGPPPSILPLSRGVTFEDLCDGVASDDVSRINRLNTLDLGDLENLKDENKESKETGVGRSQILR